MLHAIIMAGGSGTRLWPESRKNFPKQLLKLEGERSFLQQTVDRLCGECSAFAARVPLENVRIVAGKNLADAIRTQLPELPADAVLVEPCARNTSACIALAAVECLRNDPDAVLAVLPADQKISPVFSFRKAIFEAAEVVATHPEKVVTLGIEPTYPAESFGYIERDEAFPAPDVPVFRVKKFREKPSSEVAAEYLAKGNFFWNAGIFVWKAETVLNLLQKHAPGVFVVAEKIRETGDVARYFPEMENISIDYAVMEPAAVEGNVLVMAAPFAWDDVGSWRAMERIFPKDTRHNTLAGTSEKNVVLIDSNDCVIRSTDASKTVACFGLADVAVIVTPDVVLVFDKNREESVREVTAKLKAMGREDLL
ncbi:MAG: sugar phosphate nucleotidyltransferase [Planctomycetia bacterium]|nr:sugar phosphate nucleotidyltransferase [Planctomycetia bacterium]